MPADPGPALRAAALAPRAPLDTSAVLRRARHLRARRRTVLAVGALTVLLVLAFPVSPQGLRFSPPGAGSQAADEAACAVLEGPRVPNENAFVALGLSDSLPLRLVRQTTVIADRCLVDERSGRVLGVVLRLEDEAGTPVARWLLLPRNGPETSDGLVSWLLDAGPPVGEGHVMKREGALAIVADVERYALAADPSEPQLSAWGALVRSGAPQGFAVATVLPGLSRALPPADDTRPRHEGLVRGSRVLPSGIGTRLLLPSGRELEVVLPPTLQAEPSLRYRPESAGVVDEEGRTPRTSVTTADPDEVAAGLVSGGPMRLSNGAVQEVWRGGMSADPLVTAALDGWTLVLDGPDGGLAERIVAALDWSVDAEGFLLLASTDPGVLIGDGLALEVPTGDEGELLLSLGPGCENAGAELERFPGLGIWCTDGFTVVAQSDDGTVLDALHQQLRVRAASREEPLGEATVYRDPAAGLEVTYPSGWARASERLTPNLGGGLGPTEVLTLGTGGLPSGGDDCAQVPERAVEALGPGESLVTVQERLGPLGSFPPRPARFGTPDVELPETLECFANADEVEHVRYDFSDGGRAFYAYVTVRRDATERVRAEALAILDGLVIAPG